jgi:ABC-type lipoprotein release transport system permease subunit
MLMLRYAIRNLTRHRLRTTFTTLAVAFAVGLVVVGNTFIAGLAEHTLAEFTRFTGHVELRHKDYQKQWRFKPLDYNVAGFSALREKLLTVDGVKAVLGRVDFNVMLQFTDESTIVPEDKVVDESTLTDDQIFGRKVVEFAPALGVEADYERTQNKLDKRLKTGAFFTGDGKGQIVIGVELARRLGATVGSKLELVSFREGIMDAAVTVVGIMDSGSKIENRLCYVPLPLAMQLVDLQDRVTQVQVFGDSYKNSASLLASLKDSGFVSDYAAKQWNEIGIFRTIVALFSVVISMMLGAIIIVAVVGLLNTMLMTVLERQREIGVLMALGVSRRRVVAGFLMEAILFGLVGSIVGGIGGLLGSLPLVYGGVTLGAENMRSLPMALNPTIYGILTPNAIVWAVATGFVVALLGALWPAFRASAVQPLEAMRKT